MKAHSEDRMALRWLVSLAMAAVAWPMGGPFQLPAQAQNTQKTETVEQVMARLAGDTKYDPQEKLLYGPAPDGGISSKLPRGTVGHPIRQSLYFAQALLNTNREDVLPIAEAILERVIGLQDQDPKSYTYGVWPKLLAEPLPKSGYFDKNWADFFGGALLQIKLSHQPRITPALVAKIDTSIQHAARSIERRNAAPHYTNIAALGTFVTLVTAETFGLDDLKTYAMNRLRTFHAYTRHHGGFTEYNSPSYARVTLGALNSVLRYAKDPEALSLTKELHRIAWAELALHFHVPSGQHAGPHSRNYGNLSGKDFYDFLARESGGRIAIGRTLQANPVPRKPADVPADLEPLFTAPLTEPRTVIAPVIKGGPPFPAMVPHLPKLTAAERIEAAGEQPILATTYLHPDFALGTVNRAPFIPQRRLLMAHWGTSQAPSYFTVHFLRDGKGLGAAQFFSAQEKGNVLCGLNFATDGGTEHAMVPLKEGLLKAKDLRLRFEWGGAAGRIKAPAPAPDAKEVSLNFDTLKVQLAVPFAEFGRHTARWETGGNERTAWLDLVLYAGPEQSFKLAEIERAAIGFALRLTSEESSAPQVSTHLENGFLKLRWEKLRIEIPTRPGSIEELHRTFHSSR